MSIENFVSMLKSDATAYGTIMETYCPDVNEIGLENNPDNKTSSDKKYPSQKYSKCNKYNKLESNCIVKSLVKEDWTNIDKSNLDKLGLARQTRL